MRRNVSLALLARLPGSAIRAGIETAAMDDGRSKSVGFRKDHATRLFLGFGFGSPQANFGCRPYRSVPLNANVRERLPQMPGPLTSGWVITPPPYS